MYVFMGIVIAVIGAVMLIKPQAFYRLTESWKSGTAGEPSDFYLMSTRIGGGIFMLAGIAGAIALIVLG